MYIMQSLQKKVTSSDPSLPSQPVLFQREPSVCALFLLEWSSAVLHWSLLPPPLLVELFLHSNNKQLILFKLNAKYRDSFGEELISVVGKSAGRIRLGLIYSQCTSLQDIAEGLKPTKPGVFMGIETTANLQEHELATHFSPNVSSSEILLQILRSQFVKK